jgi:hypothetical protein
MDESGMPTLVRQEDADPAVLRALARMPGTVTLGQRRYPTPADYRQAISECASGAGLQSSDYATAQRAWFLRGQSGCVFARFAAMKEAGIGWDYIVWGGQLDHLTLQVVNRIDDLVQEATEDDETQVVSVLLPTVETGADALAVVDALVAGTSFWVERELIFDDRLVVYLRRSISGDGQDVQAWVMAFGPFGFIPNTRRAPFFELVIRAKPKPDWIFERLNPDRAAAHLADVPLVMPPRHWEHRWQSTLRKTREILGHEPNEVSSARATISVPIELVATDRVRMAGPSESTDLAANSY